MTHHLDLNSILKNERRLLIDEALSSPLAFLGRNASRGHLFDDRVSPVPDGSEASFSHRSRAEDVTSPRVIIQWKTPETVPPLFCKGRQLFQGFYIIFR